MEICGVSPDSVILVTGRVAVHKFGERPEVGGLCNPLEAQVLLREAVGLRQSADGDGVVNVDAAGIEGFAV